MSLFHYDADSGTLRWKYRPASTFTSLRDAEAWNARYCNLPAGSRDELGYIRVRISSEGIFFAHRIIYKMLTGDEPDVIDHIDGNPWNNSPSNLRSVGHLENSQNSCVSVLSTTGIRGVSWEKVRKKWRACITVNRKFKHLGNFSDFGEAVKARKAAEAHYGFHENHGRKPLTSGLVR